MVLAFSPHSTTPSPLTLDVVFGIGTTKCAFPALKDGSSVLIKFAFPSLTTAHLMIVTELASLASRDMTSRKEPASSLHSTTPSLPTLDAASGIGTIKSVCPAPMDGSSMPTRSACPFLTNVLLMTTAEPA